MSNFVVAEDAFLLRTDATGDKIYLIQGEERYWIKNPETLKKLGFSFGQEKNVKYKELIKYRDAGHIDMKPRKLDLKDDEPKPGVEAKTEVDKKPILNYRRSA